MSYRTGPSLGQWSSLIQSAINASVAAYPQQTPPGPAPAPMVPPPMPGLPPAVPAARCAVTSVAINAACPAGTTKFMKHPSAGGSVQSRKVAYCVPGKW